MPVSDDGGGDGGEGVRGNLSCAEALSMADRFRGKVKDLFIETMIHYLVLD